MDGSDRRTFGLLGSGEFLPWAEEVDRWLVENARSSSDRVIVLPTASAPEGNQVFDRWASMGIDHYRRLGFRPEVLPLKTRADAEREDLAETLQDAALIFFSGGNPRHLTDALRDTPFWRGVLEALATGTALAGCSAGVVFLGDVAMDSSRHEEMSPDVWGPGIGLFGGIEFGVHWDAADRYRPGMQDFMRRSLTPGALQVFIDEETALVGDGDAWTVMGRGSVTLALHEYERTYRAGEGFAFSEVGTPA